MRITSPSQEKPSQLSQVENKHAIGAAAIKAMPPTQNPRNIAKACAADTASS
jgi:hypothetical protein